MGFLNSDTDVFGWPTIAVGTHIFRVSNRNQLVIGKNINSVEQKL
jgi:endonuclease-3